MLLTLLWLLTLCRRYVLLNLEKKTDMELRKLQEWEIIFFG